MTERTVHTLLPGERHDMADGTRLVRALPAEGRSSVGPFVFLDDFETPAASGIGDSPHPHAGIEVISYLLSGAQEHHDSQGNVERLTAGGTQWLRAGRGLLHREKPLAPRRGLQIWATLPPALQDAEPTYHSDPHPPLRDLGGADVTVLAGHVAEVLGPIQLAGPALLVVARLPAGASLHLPVAGNEAPEIGVYPLDATVHVGETAVPAGTLAVLDDTGATVPLHATAETPVLVLGGPTVTHPLLFAGSFVVDSTERLATVKRDFAAGHMGTLDGVPF